MGTRDPPAGHVRAGHGARAGQVHGSGVGLLSWTILDM